MIGICGISVQVHEATPGRHGGPGGGGEGADGESEAIVADTMKQAPTGVPADEAGIDEAMRALASVLVCGDDGGDSRYGDMGVAAEEALDVRGVLPREEEAAAAGGGAMRKRKWCMAFLYRT
jgi:hypothetical protein